MALIHIKPAVIGQILHPNQIKGCSGILKRTMMASPEPCSISRWKVAPVFLKPNGMDLNGKKPSEVMTAVF